MTTEEKIKELEKRIELLERAYGCNAHPHLPYPPPCAPMPPDWTNPVWATNQPLKFPQP
jgi:hypothetical protein